MNKVFFLIFLFCLLFSITLSACSDEDDDSDDNKDVDDDDDDNDNNDDSTGDDDDDDFIDDKTPPTISGSSPADSDIECKLQTKVTVTFDEAMNQSSTESAFSMADGSKATVAGTFSWDTSGAEMTFTPDEKLAEYSSYSFTVNTEAADLAGNKLASSYTAGFTTVDLWTATFDATIADEDAVGMDVDTDSQGNVYVVGYDQVGPSPDMEDILVQKYDMHGVLSDTWHFGDTLRDRGHAIVLDDNENIYITGYVTDTSSSVPELYVAKMDTTGNVAWSQIHEGGSSSMGNAITVDGDGNVYVAGWEHNFLTNENDAWWGIFYADGQQGWDDYTGGMAEEDDQATGIVINSNNVLIVTGTLTRAPGLIEVFVETRNLDDSIDTDITTFMTPFAYETLASNIIVLQNDEMVIGGAYRYEVVSDYCIGYLWKLNYDWHILAESYGGNTRLVTDVDVDENDFIYVSMETGDPTDTPEQFIGKASPDSLGYYWTVSHSSSGIERSAKGVGVDSNGNVYGIGYVDSEGDGDLDLWLSKLDNDGNESD